MASELIKRPILRGYEEVKDVVDAALKLKCVIAGGYARYMLSTEETPAKPGDLDIFCPDDKAYSDMMYCAPLSTLEEVEVTAYSTRLAHFSIEVNLIKPEVLTTDGDHAKFLADFDFTICQALVDNAEYGWVTSEYERAEELGALILTEWKLKNPVSTMYRAIKYAKRGYDLPAETIIDIFEAWQKVDKAEIISHYLSGPYGWP